jgi:hypothetical protein
MTKKYLLTLSLLAFFLIISSCSEKRKTEEEKSSAVKTDTTEIIKSFIYGLWSMDSGNSLNNIGYYFRPDGTVDFVAADVSGFWELNKNDSIKIIYNSFNQEYKADFKIDSISEGKMTISDKDGSYLFRKVPFGMNNEGVVMQGFSGSLAQGQEKVYSFDIPTAKKISLKLKTENKDIAFRVYENEKEVTSLPVQEWTSILVRSGKYKTKVIYPKTKKGNEEGGFDLKVIGY